ncbi:putative membrane protein [Duffyella gerundensis]|uniref:Putative membrane protein n=1 Tax=Duffyella gerundensis TaxID=1619313 RepID=A0A0U5L6Q4_9GAMM|nr:putative membrane protein [Duffyella gerundensis]
MPAKHPGDLQGGLPRPAFYKGESAIGVNALLLYLNSPLFLSATANRKK